MLKKFDQAFKNKLWKAIANIENSSLAEIVVIVKPRSDNYGESSLMFSSALAFLVFSFLMFSNLEFHHFDIYLYVFLSFLSGMILTTVLEPLQRLLIRKKDRERMVEIMARASFQKGGIHHTSSETGILVYVSLFEKKVIVVPDRGAEMAIPPAEWKKIRNGFDQIFEQTNPADALIAQLNACQNMISRCIPPVENDINELPDDLEINF